MVIGRHDCSIAMNGSLALVRDGDCWRDTSPGTSITTVGLSASGIAAVGRHCIGKFAHEIQRQTGGLARSPPRWASLPERTTMRIILRVFLSVIELAGFALRPTIV